jgi:hypothetical protein
MAILITQLSFVDFKNNKEQLMADTTLAQVEELAQSLPPEEQRLLAQSLLQNLGANDTANQATNPRDIDEIERVVEAARGAWGKGKTLDEIDEEIRKMREWDWSREWDK